MITDKESIDDRKKRSRRILNGLRKGYPEADCALKHKSAFELLVATILSAQSTDETVNKVTPLLFKRYPTPEKLAKASRDKIEEIVRPSGFFRQSVAMQRRYSPR